MSSRLEAGIDIGYKREVRHDDGSSRRAQRRQESRYSRRKLERISDERLRKKLLKKLTKRKMSKSLGEQGLLYELELIEEASRRGIPSGLPAPVPIEEDGKGEEIEKQKPDTYESAREHIKAEKFEPAVKILWKLKCNGKYSETEDKAWEEGDWFTIATLRFFNAAGRGGFNNYLNAFHVVESLNGSQGSAFFKEVVEKNSEFYRWDTGIREEESKRLDPLRNDIADAKMKAHARTRKRKMLDSALVEAEHIDNAYSKSEALREVALAFAQSGLEKEALDTFKKSEDALPEKRDSDKEMYDYLMAMKDISSSMAKAGFRNEAYGLFMRTAEIASPFRGYQYDNDRVGAEALIEIGLAQWKAGFDRTGVEKTFRDVHNVMVGSLLPDYDAPVLRTKWGAAYAKMDLSNDDLVNEAVGKFEKAAEELFGILGRESLDCGDHHKFSEALINLVSAIAEVGRITKAYEYFERGIDRYNLEKFPTLCAKGHVAIGAAYMKTNLIDRATSQFHHVMGYMKEDGPSRQSAEMLAQMGLAYAEAGLDMKARRKFEESAIEAGELTYFESSLADIHRISTYIQAAKNDGFLSGLNRRVMYEALCVHANNIEDSNISVEALLHIATAQRYDGMHREAQTTLRMAEERVDLLYDREIIGYDVDNILRLLSISWAEFGKLRESKEYASMLYNRNLFSKVSAAIVIAKARRAAGIDAESLTEKEMELLQEHADDDSVLSDALAAAKSKDDRDVKKPWRASLPLRGKGFWPPDQWGPSQPLPLQLDSSGNNVRRIGNIERTRDHSTLHADVQLFLHSKTNDLRNMSVSKVDIIIRITSQDAVVLQSLEPKTASPILENELRRMLSSRKDDYVKDLDSSRKETLELHFDYTL